MLVVEATARPLIQLSDDQKTAKRSMAVPVSGLSHVKVTVDGFNDATRLVGGKGFVTTNCS